jgi:hypothetical protein
MIKIAEILSRKLKWRDTTERENVAMGEYLKKKYKKIKPLKEK